MSAKKQLLIDTALTLFYQQGINNVGINEVLKVSGVAKKTLYNHFPTKDELVLSTLKARHTVFIDWLTHQIEPCSNDEHVALKLFEGLDRWFNEEVVALSPFKGCFFINSAAEYRDETHPINQQCRLHKLAIKALITSKLSNTSDELVELICLLKEGAIVSAYVNKDLDAAKKCIPIVAKYIKANRLN